MIGLAACNGSHISMRTCTRKPRIVVKNSRVHGRGVYAARSLKAGENIIEYQGERIPWKEADRRPPSDPDDPHHTFFFSLDDRKTVIDAGVGGNARAGSTTRATPIVRPRRPMTAGCSSRRCAISRAGEELNYDYGLMIDERITPTLKKNYECRCGSKNCRGTMLGLSKRQMPKTAKSAKSRRKPG